MSQRRSLAAVPGRPCRAGLARAHFPRRVRGHAC